MPDPRKATDLEKLRRRALLREFATYTQGRGELRRFRSEAVRAGFDDAWDRRDYATIVAIGRRLPNDAFTADSALGVRHQRRWKLGGRSRPTLPAYGNDAHPSALLYYVDNAQQLSR